MNACIYAVLKTKCEICQNKNTFDIPIYVDKNNDIRSFGIFEYFFKKPNHKKQINEDI